MQAARSTHSRCEPRCRGPQYRYRRGLRAMWGGGPQSCIGKAMVWNIQAPQIIHDSPSSSWRRMGVVTVTTGGVIYRGAHCHSGTVTEAAGGRPY